MTDPTANNCCGVDCDIVASNDNTSIDVIPNEDSGTWSFSTGEYSTSSANALRHTTADSGAHPWKVQSHITFNLSSGDDQKARVVGGFLDDENFLFAEYRVIWDGINSWWVLQFAVGKVESGVETVLLVHPWEPDAQEMVSGGATSHTATISLCWDGDQLTAECPNISDVASGDTGEIVSINGITPPGNKAGIGTRDIGGGSVEFTAFEFTLSDVEDCDTCDESCCEGPSHEDTLLEISGGGSGYHVWVAPTGAPAGNIRVQASELNGTHTIPYNRALVSSITGGPVVTPAGSDGHGGDGHCRWSSAIVLDAEYYNGTTWVACKVSLVVNILRQVAATSINMMFLRDGVGDCYQTATGGFPSLDSSFPPDGPTAVLNYIDEDPIPCEDWTDWQDTVNVPNALDADFVSDFTVRYMAA